MPEADHPNCVILFNNREEQEIIAYQESANFVFAEFILRRQRATPRKNGKGIR